MSKAIDILKKEHENILKAIELLLNECEVSEKSGIINSKYFLSAVDFIKNYADKFHHAKEEDVLFVELCKDSVNMHCNPIQQMLHEHDLGRRYIKELEAGIKSSDLPKVLAGARSYVYLLKDHIYKEDNILYPIADEALSDKTKDEILAKFEKIAKQYSKINKRYETFYKTE